MKEVAEARPRPRWSHLNSPTRLNVEELAYICGPHTRVARAARTGDVRACVRACQGKKPRVRLRSFCLRHVGKSGGKKKEKIGGKEERRWNRLVLTIIIKTNDPSRR